MRHVMIIALSVSLTVVFSATLFAQETVDVRGTWVGDTDFPGTPDKDHVILVLKKEGDKYTGTISVGALKDVPVEKLNFKDEDSFDFEFPLTQGDNKVTVSVKLNYVSDRILGNKLMGAWSMESGDYGLLELEQKKQ